MLKKSKYTQILLIVVCLISLLIAGIAILIQHPISDTVEQQFKRIVNENCNKAYTRFKAIFYHDNDIYLTLDMVTAPDGMGDSNIYLQMKRTAELAAEYIKSNSELANKKRLIIQRYQGRSMPEYVNMYIDIKTGKITEYRISEISDILSEQFTDLNGVEFLDCPKFDMNSIPYSEDLKELYIKKIGNNDLSQFCNAPNLESLNFYCPVQSDFSKMSNCKKLKKLTICYFYDEQSGDKINYESLRELQSLEKLEIIIINSVYENIQFDKTEMLNELQKLLPNCDIAGI